MDALKRLVAAKRQSSTRVPGKPKWRKRSEIVEEQTKERQRRWEEKTKKFNEEVETLRNELNESTRPKIETLDEVVDESSLNLPPIADVFRHLRRLGEPVTLFGETHLQRCRRLRHMQTANELRKGQVTWHHALKRAGTGLDDDDHADERDAEFFKQLQANPNLNLVHSPDIQPQPTPTHSSDEASTEGQEGDKKKKSMLGDDEPDLHFLIKPEPVQGPLPPPSEMDEDQDDPRGTRRSLDLSSEEYVLQTLKAYLKFWESDLDARPDVVKSTPKGRQDLNTFQQAVLYIKPLLRILKHRNCPDDILNPIHKICQCLELRDYVNASNHYIKLAIGNAPWPIGVTCVGIHDRSAREKISTDQIAHILNDEAQRKYIQSLKRIMTFAQKRFPTDPSKMVGWT